MDIDIKKMVSVIGAVKKIIKDLLRNPIFLGVFAVWFLNVLAEYEVLDVHPIKWLNTTISSKNPAAKGVQSLSQTILRNIHLFTMVSGLVINIFYLRNSQVQIINAILIFVTCIIDLSVSILFLRFIVVIICEFLYFSVTDPQHKFSILIILGSYIYFEHEVQNSLPNSNSGGSSNSRTGTKPTGG